MNRRARWTIVLGVGLLVSGCHSASVSGSYIASSPTTVDLLQLTESKDGQLLGSLSEFGYKADGSLNRFSLGLTGTTDGHSITIVAKPNGLSIGSMTISGTADGGTIALTTQDGTQTFAAARPADFRAQVSKLTQQATAVRVAKARQQEQEQTESRLRGESNAAEALATRLENYSKQVEAKHDLAAFHSAHAKLLAAARHDLEIQKTLPRGSYASGQVDFRINQISFQLNQFDFPYSSFINEAKGHLQDADQAIANSPCHTTNDNLAGCQLESRAEAEYLKAKVTVESEMRDISSSIAQDNAAMKAISQQADAYDRQ